MSPWLGVVLGCWAAGVLLLGPCSRAENILNVIRKNNNLEKFFDALIRDPVAKVMLEHRGTTVFAPTNDAFERYMDNKGSVQGDKLLHYHMANTPVTSDRFHISPFLSTDIVGNLPLWIRVEGSNSFTKDFYVNNAKIIQKDLLGSTSKGEQQVLHIIDEVLEPLVAKSSDASYNNPDARKFMSNYLAFSLHNYDLSDFEQRVQQMSKDDIFITSNAGSTFFIPINSGFKENSKGKVDDRVIDAHVIKDQVFFTRTFPSDPQDSAANADNLKIQLSVMNETISVPNGPSYNKIYVQSNTILGDYFHKTGAVIAEIVKPNIPVRNGVVHLISRPLVIMDRTVEQILEDEKDRRLSRLLSIMKSTTPELLAELSTEDPITFFAPSNEAINSIQWSTPNTLQREKILRILHLHIVPREITTSELIRQDRLLVPTKDKDRQLYFRYITQRHSTFRLFSVEGGGVNASIITADIRGINGVVHIINRVLGVPFGSIYMKLREDVDLRATYNLSQQDHWYRELDNTNKHFTLFVPNNEAWEKVRVEMITEHYKLFAGVQSYSVASILNRHVIVNRELTVSALAAEKDVSTLQGQTFVTVTEVPVGQAGLKEKVYWVEWANVKAKIVRADIETTNGIIHVIDSVLMQQDDVSYLPENTQYSSHAMWCSSVLMTTLVMLLAVKFLA